MELNYPTGAQWAMLSKNGKFIQGFYKNVEGTYNDGTKAMRLYHKSSLPVWHPSNYTFEKLLTLGFEIILL